MLEINLLGKFAIKYNGKPVTISSRAAQSLFAYLILTAGTLHRREKLGGMFWPDTSEEKARAYLRHELWLIRKTLASKSKLDYLTTDDIHISFKASAQHWLDVNALKDLSESASIEELMQGLSLFHGELLPGFYEDWVAQEREHLQIIYEQKIARLLELLEKKKRWQEILEWSEHWISLGQGTEAAYRHLMIAYDALGDRARVSSTYQRYVQALRELDLEPSEETRALAFKRTPSMNIPIPLTSFIGREQELKEVADLFSKSRLVTLTGSGGVGKTRLAIQVVAEILDLFPDGVWFLDLAPLSDPSLVPNTLASLLGLRESGELSVTDLLFNYFRTRTALVIFDNCEHLIESCAQLVNSLLTSCENLSIFATSREALRVSGEISYRVPSLEIPKLNIETAIDALAKIESVQLFMERAVLASPGFAVRPQNALVIAKICQRLDGIPLAIELAAGRIIMLTVDQILKRLDDRFNLLTGSLRTVLPRHQTLRATIDWSYSLLTEDERALFQQLAVFVGGWSLETIEAVCAGGKIDEKNVLGLLTNLMEKSLVTSIADDQRYGMLETVKHYARERLSASNEAQIYLEAHAQHFLLLAEEAEPRLIGIEQVMWVDRLEVEHENLRAALTWFLKAGKKEEAQRLGCALGRFWWLHGHLTEGRQWLRKILMRVDTVSKAHAKALYWAGTLAWLQRNYEESKIFLGESVDQYRELGYRLDAAYSLNRLGGLVLDAGEYARSQEIFEDSLAIFRELMDKRGIASALNGLGDLAYLEGDIDKAYQLYEECLTVMRELGDKWGTAVILSNLGFVAKTQGNYPKTWSLFDESLVIRRGLHDPWGIAHTLTGVASLIFLEGQTIKSAQIQGAIKALLEQIGAPLSKYEAVEYDKTSAALKTMLGEADYQQAFEKGKILSIEQAIAYALEMPSK